LKLDNPTNTAQPITPQEAHAVLSEGLYADDPALRIVLQDYNRAETSQQLKSWAAAWTSASALYQSPTQPVYWEGTTSRRSSIPFFTVARAVNSLTPQIVNGLFFDNPPFQIQPRPKTRMQTARAIGAVLAYQLEEIGFREEIRLGVMNALLYGTGIWKWGWETFDKEVKRYKRATEPLVLPNPVGGPDAVFEDPDEEIEEVVETQQVDRPIFQHIVNLRDILVDPTLNVPDIRKAKYVIHRQYLTWEDLDRLRERPGFKIPSRKELLDLFLPPVEMPDPETDDPSKAGATWDMRAEGGYKKATEDLFNQPLEVLERWDSDSCIIVLQKKLVICNDTNPYGTIPYLSVNWWDVPEAFWGVGLAKTLGAEQQLQQAITNTWLDQAALNLNGVYVRVRGRSVPTQSIRIAPGRIVEVENKDDFKPLDRLPAVPEAQQHLALSAARVQDISGVNPITAGGMAGDAGHSNLGRTAAGASLIGSGANIAPAEFVEKLSNQVFLPFLYAAHDMNRSLLPVRQLKQILNDDLEHEFMQERGDVMEIIEGQVKFSILAGAKMSDRRNMAQSLPLLTQYIATPQMMQQLAMLKKTVDIEEVIRMWFDVSSWKNHNDVIRDMTPEEMKRWEAMQPGAQVQAKAQAQSQLLQQQHDNKLEVVDAENVAKASREVLRHAFQEAATDQAVDGEPGNVGFGSQM
jgi:hypothetical protein